MPSLAKELMMREVAKEFENNPYAFITNFEGLSVADISDFRRTVEKVAGRSLVVKHSMAKKVFASQNYAAAEKLLKGQILVTFGKSEPQAISKTIVEFAKTHEKLIPAGVLFEKQVYGKEFIKQLAILPNRQELLTQVVVRIKSPISGFVLTLGQIMRGFVCALNEIKKKKEQLQTA